MKYIKNLLTVFFSVVITLVLIEFFLIWEDSYISYPNPYNIEINDINYNLYLDKKKLFSTSKKRLLVVGDSFVQQKGCAYKEKTLPDELQRRIKKRKESNIIFRKNKRSKINI